jgi:hypothetical protein
MRVLRAKVVRKNLKFYKLIFGMDSPYSVSMLRVLFLKADRGSPDIFMMNCCALGYS